jgi:hypothetical protein
MTKAKIQEEINDYRELLNSPDVDDFEKELAREEIATLEGELAKMDGSDEPQPASETKKRGRKPNPPSARKTKVGHPELHPGDKTKSGVTIMDANGNLLDLNGEVIQVGDTVQVTNKNGSFLGTIINLAKKRGGGHQVKYKSKSGQTKTEMFQPDAVIKVGSAGEDLSVVKFDEKLPVKVMKSAKVVGRTDCDENEIVLVTPEEKTVVVAPMVADPENGDKIAINKQGHPMYVVEGDAAKTDYEKADDAKITKKAGKVEKVENKGENEEEAKKLDAQEIKDETVKTVKPTRDCDFVKGEEEPALQTFLEGMRQAWRQDKTSDKIIRVMLRKSDSRVVLEIKRYWMLDLASGMYYYAVCLNTGKLTKTEKPVRGAYQALMGADSMKEFYRYPNSNTCRRVSKELHVTCYREGDCSDERKKRLIELFTANCRKREDALTRSYRKYSHEMAAARWKGYDGEKSYAQIYREVIKELKD